MSTDPHSTYMAPSALHCVHAILLTSLPLFCSWCYPGGNGGPERRVMCSRTHRWSACLRSPQRPTLSPAAKPQPEQHTLPITDPAPGLQRAPAWSASLSEGPGSHSAGCVHRQPHCGGFQKVGHSAGGGGRCGLKTLLPPSTLPGQQSHPWQVSSNDLGNS